MKEKRRKFYNRLVLRPKEFFREVKKINPDLVLRISYFLSLFQYFLYCKVNISSVMQAGK